MRNSTEIISYIKYLRKKRKMSLEELSKKVGIAKSTLSRYENGSRDFPINDIHLYAEALGVSTFDLLGVPEVTSKEADFTRLPFYGNVAAGALSIVEPTIQQNIEFINIPNQLLGKNQDSKGLFAMKVNGESMNKIIPNGSIVIAKECIDSEYKNNDIVIFSYDNEYSLKRLKTNDVEGGLLFKSESFDKSFKDIFIPHNTCLDFKICAKIISYTVFID